MQAISFFILIDSPLKVFECCSVLSVMSRIHNPGGNAPTGAAMILAFICLLTNALFGGINFVQFGWMRRIRTHQEANLTVVCISRDGTVCLSGNEVDLPCCIGCDDYSE